MPRPNSAEVLKGIDPGDTAAEYRRRSLDDLGDRELLEAAVGIVSRPATKVNSFSLHVPLELLARACLLPLVDPQHRDLARMQIVAMTAFRDSRYQDSETPSPATARSEGDPIERACRAIEVGDELSAELAALELCELPAEDIVDGLAQAFALRIDAAHHSHIFLRLLLGVQDHYPGFGRPLVRVLLVYLARSQPRHHRWANSVADQVPTPGVAPAGAALLAAMLQPRRGEVGPEGGIVGILRGAEAADAPEQALGGLVRSGLSQDGEAELRQACRVAPMAMLGERDGEARYGWTHCLTIPEATWQLLDHVGDRRRVTLTALQDALSFRSTLGRRDLSSDWAAQLDRLTARGLRHNTMRAAGARFVEQHRVEPEAAITALVSGASVRSDADLVKHTVAALACAERDPEAADLHLASAAALLENWRAEIPDDRLGSDLTRRD